MSNRFTSDEWLPSRFNLGIFKLIAFAIARSVENDRPTSGAYLHRNRHQHPLEPTLLSLAFWLIPATHVALLAGAGSAAPRLVVPLVFAAMLLAVPIGWVLVALVFTPVAGGVSRLSGRSNHDVQEWIAQTTMLILAACSVVFAWPSRYLGWAWIGLTFVELIATLACFALRRPFEELAKRLPAGAF